MYSEMKKFYAVYKLDKYIAKFYVIKWFMQYINMINI